MSYDYFFFAKPGDGKVLAIDAIGPDLPSIGSLEFVRGEISRAFPAVRWEPPRGEIRAWFGLQGPPEFLLLPEDGGKLSCFKAAFIEREEVLALAASMNLVAFDPQRGEILGA